MREFIVVSHEAPTTPDFSLDDLPGAGRMDLLARCVTASMLSSHGIRENVQLSLVLGDQFTIRFDSSTIRGLHPDERSTAARIRQALEERDEAIGHIPVEVTPGVTLYRMGLAATLDALPSDNHIFQLASDGTPAATLEPPEEPVFVLSDHRPFDPDESKLLESVRDAQLSIGPVELHADHAITVAHNWLDTRGFAEY
jgi:tRNA (pseudouridine54-N1)-methyltransferase